MSLMAPPARSARFERPTARFLWGDAEWAGRPGAPIRQRRAGTLDTMATSRLDEAGDTPDRRRLLKSALAGAVGAAVWHTPGVQVRDLAGARALAAGSAPLVATVVATSFSRVRGGATFQHWGSTGGSTFYTVPFASGDVEIRVRRRATSRSSTVDNSNGQWTLFVNTVPTGCTSCEVTQITMSHPVGTSVISGVPGIGTGLLRRANALADQTTAVTATFTVTCT